MYLGNPARSGQLRARIDPPVEQIWRKRLGSGIGPALVSRDGLVAVPTAKGEIHFLRVDDGKKAGKLKFLKTAVTGAWPSASRFVVVARTGRSTLACYDLAAGQWCWRKAAGPVDTEPTIVGDTLITASTYGRVLATRLDDGATLWETKLKTQVHSSPSAARGRLLVGTDSGELVCMRLRDGTIVWRKRIGAPIFAPPVIRDTLLFLGSTDSTFRAFRLEDGSELWSFRTGGRIVLAGAVVPDRGWVLFGSNDHFVHCLRTSDGTVVWRAKLGAPPGTAPLVTRKTVWVGGLDRKLYALQLDTGDILWSIKLKGRVRTAPIPVGPVLLVASEDYYVYAFRHTGEMTP